MFLRQISDPNLAQYSYFIGCQRSGEAIIVDPERDILALSGDRLSGGAQNHRCRGDSYPCGFREWSSAICQKRSQRSRLCLSGGRPVLAKRMGHRIS